MPFVRIISALHYNRTKRAFQSTAFRNSSDGSGISVILRDCIEATTGNICEHIVKYYSTIAREPIMFFLIDEEEFAEPIFFEQYTWNEDDCHYNLKNLTDQEARKYFKEKCNNLENIFICSSEMNFSHLTYQEINILFQN